MSIVLAGFPTKMTWIGRYSWEEHETRLDNSPVNRPTLLDGFNDHLICRMQYLLISHGQL